MGWVDIPAAPPRGGKMAATLVLERDELLQTVELLKGALAELTRAGVGSSQVVMPPIISTAQQAAAAQQAARPAGMQAPPVAVPVVVPVAAPTPAGSFQMPRPVVPVAQLLGPPVAVPVQAPVGVPQQQQQQQQQPAAMRPAYQQPQPAAWPQPQPQIQQQQQQQPMQAPSQAMAQLQLQQQQPMPRPVYLQQQPQRVPVPAVPMPVAAVQQPRMQQQPQVRPAAPQPAPVQQQQQQPAASGWATPAAAAPSAAAAAAAPSAAASSRWQLSYTSDSDDHANVAVSAVAYAQSLPGLPGGDGHAGWLVSASKGMLNLWEANRAASGDEMALLCMHSQAVDLTVTKLVLEPNTKMLFGASLASDASECISVHSMDTDVGLLAYRYKFAPPPGRPKSTQRLMQQVVSVHGMTPGLRSSVIASYGERLLVFEAKTTVRANSVLNDASFYFVAHPSSVITCLHRSSIPGSCMLFSGAQNGHIHMWDLKAPPKDSAAAMRMLRHTKNVTGLTQVSDDRLASSSMDGTVLLWDLRSPGSPLHTARAPDGAGILKLAPGPWGDVLAVSTAKGLHCLELFDFDAPMANIAPYPLPRPFTDIVFNQVTHDLYAGCGNGSVQVFSRLA